MIRRNGIEIATTDTTTSYTDGVVQRGATYTYTVVAVDAAENVSPTSNALVVTIPTEADTTPPSAPANLTATVAGDDVTLAWTASTDDVGVTRYVIERNGADVAETPAVSYVDLDRPAGTYQYRVFAEDAAGNRSAPSNTRTVTVDNVAPAGQFTAQPTIVAPGQIVTFTDAHPGNHRRNVTFGDGTRLSTRTSTFTKAYGAPGSYVVTLGTLDVVTGLRVDLSLTITVTITPTAAL